MERRQFLKDSTAAGAACIAVSAGILAPGMALAGATDPFQEKSVDEVLEALGAAAAEATDKIKIKAPEVAENGAAVPVEIASSIEGTTEIISIITTNPKPLAARYTFGKRAAPSVQSRFKIGQTTDVIALAKADGKYYTAKAQVKVTKGGCGG